MRKIILTMLVAVAFVLNAAAQDRTITGRIIDEKGVPVSGVSVTSTNGKTGTQTDAEGNYQITVSGNAKTLTFSNVNFETLQSQIRGTQMNVVINSKTSVLEDVVVVGYQTIKRKELIGSVTTVSNKEIAQKPIVNFTQLLQGKSPGLQITGETGRPGASAYIRIRGVGSLNASSEPLIILDGVQVSSQAYSSINPNDIEDIAVLKDAAAAALYGSRAANGVLVITTKKGRGKPELRYSFQYGRSRALDIKNANIMNSAEKLQYEFEGKYTNQLLGNLIASKISGGSLPAGSTLFTVDPTQRQNLWNELSATGAGDWRKFYLQEGSNKTHEISLSGSADKIRYYLSLNKNDNVGTLFGSKFNRTGGRLNVEYQAKDWIKIGTNLSLTRSKEEVVRERFNAQGPYTSIFLTNPYEKVYNANGSYNLTLQGYSPLEGTVNNPFTNDRIAAFTTIFAEAKLLKYLTLKSQIGINYNNLSQENYITPGSNLANILGFNQKTDLFQREVAYVFTNTANWKQTIGNTKHSYSILVGQEFNKDQFYQLFATGRNFPSRNLTTLENSGTPIAASTSRFDFALASYFSSISYDYAKKYYLTLSGRRDGSSRFGANNKYANFGAVGLAWDAYKENFVNKINFLSALKFKASQGTSGNNTVGNYDNLGTYALNGRYNNAPGATPFRLPNAGLSWEINKTTDLAMEFGLFHDIITGSAGYFKRQTNKLLYNVNVSYTTGFAFYRGNIGNLENKGIELELTGNIIRKKDLNWSISATYTHVDNKITSLYSDNVPQGIGRLKVGEPILTYFLVRAAGVNPANGKQQYLKKDGTVTETFSASDAVLLQGKSPVIKFYGSLSTNFTYKAFDISAQMYYSGGNYIYNTQYNFGTGGGNNIDVQQFTSSFNYWKKPGDVAFLPNILDGSQGNQTTDKYLEKGDYITLRDVTIGYNLSSALANKIKLKGFRFFLQGTNLYLGTKYHGLPETGSGNSETPGNNGQQGVFAYPQARSVTAGFDIRF